MKYRCIADIAAYRPLLTNLTCALAKSRACLAGCERSTIDEDVESQMTKYVTFELQECVQRLLHSVHRTHCQDHDYSDAHRH